ncbi:MAG TPA: prepilin-type N-terminal cleavage/methylation domain-containing protein [Solirubrobacterales bacterium]|nr:prepilin-type N-terminal cleavage/methylation domain-containing protein [Solirubrobacterales bacterium]
MRRRLRTCSREGGFTLVELLVASTMGAVVMAAVASLVISAVRDQPKISKQAQNITTARWVLERMTREIRNGIAVTTNATYVKPNVVSFEAYVRRTSCGSGAQPASTASPIKCQVTYTCTTTSCSRIEATPGTFTGTARTIFTGINSNQVFSYAPNATKPTYIKVTLRLPNPSGVGALTVSNGASLRNATLGY